MLSIHVDPPSQPGERLLRGFPRGSDSILGNLHVSVIVSKHPQVHHIIFSSVYAQRSEEDVLHFYFYLLLPREQHEYLTKMP